MVLIHKLLKTRSLRSFTSPLWVVATACVFIASKVRYMPVTLADAAFALFKLDKLLHQSSSHAAHPTTFPGASTVVRTAEYTVQRDRHYRELIETEEHKVLEAIAFDFEILDNLPYSYIRTFCETHAQFSSREQLHHLAFSFCNDSFKLPLCLYFHPKVIAAACV